MYVVMVCVVLYLLAFVLAEKQRSCFNHLYSNADLCGDE